MSWPAHSYHYLGWRYAFLRAQEMAKERNLKMYVYKQYVEGKPFWVASWDPRGKKNTS